MTKIATRNVAIDGLRCLLMFLIVLHHAAYHGVWHGDTTQRLLFFLTTIAIYWHVDAFISISGWFGIKFRWSKFIRLWGVVLFYHVLGLALCFAIAGRPQRLMDLFPSGGWFVGCYLMLMLMAPLINHGIEALGKLGGRALFCAWLTFAVGMVLNWMPTNLFSAVSVHGGDGYSILCMMFVYVTARVLKYSAASWLSSRKLAGVVLFTYVAITGLCVGVLLMLPHGHLDPLQCVFNLSQYNAPHVWLAALAVLVLFSGIKWVPVWLESVIVYISPSMFGIFLIHEVMPYGRELFLIPQTYLRTHTTLSALAIVAMSAIFVYVIALLVDLVRRALVCMFRSKADQVLGVIDSKWEDFCRDA